MENQIEKILSEWATKLLAPTDADGYVVSFQTIKNAVLQSANSLIFFNSYGDWIKHYIANNYLEVDPRVKKATTQCRPVLWNVTEQKGLTRQVRELYDASYDYGVCAGVTFVSTRAQQKCSTISLIYSKPTLNACRIVSAFEDSCIPGRYLNELYIALTSENLPRVAELEDLMQQWIRMQDKTKALAALEKKRGHIPTLFDSMV